MVAAHIPLHLDKCGLVHKKIIDIPKSFIWIVILFDEGFEYDDGAKFRGFIATNNEPLCIELCNSVQCHIVVNFSAC
jgi:hypothetical protein